MRAPKRRAQTQRELEELTSSRIISTIVLHRAVLWPFAVVLLTFMFALDAALWQLLVIACAFGTLALLGRFGRHDWREDRLTGNQIMMTAWVAGLAQLSVVFALGGLAGPLMPAVALVAVVMNVIATGRIGLIFVLCVQVPAVWIFAWVQASGALPELVPTAWEGLFAPAGTPGWGPWVGAAIMTLMLIGGMTVGRVLRSVLIELMREQIEEREVQLEIHADSARTLSRLSAEIAHELKNPLASIKGLASLVRKDLDGTAAERMDVLRREVDRMQGILEEFLNFSRPVVPLDQEPVDLVELVTDVVALHEAAAAQKGVRLEAPREQPDGAAHLRCDPRKVRQIVINLVQNAIDATPRGARVQVELERDVHGAAIRVVDEGSGLAEGVSERVFTVGFTTKDEGHGIGLVVARGLARQHGGELSLENGASRGCIATLRLPSQPSGEIENGASHGGVVAA